MKILIDIPEEEYKKIKELESVIEVKPKLFSLCLAVAKGKVIKDELVESEVSDEEFMCKLMSETMDVPISDNNLITGF